MCPTDCKVQITHFSTSSDKRKQLQKLKSTEAKVLR